MTEARDTSENLYDRLGVDADATGAEITRAYRRRAREHHPDTNPDGGAQAFADLTDAYDVLKDPASRRAYDDARRGGRVSAATGTRIQVRHATPRSGQRSSGEPDARRTRTAPGARRIELRLTFDQAALGTTTFLRVSAPCRTCRAAEPVGTACRACGGSGSTAQRHRGFNIRTGCTSCGGTGRRHPEICPACLDSGAERRPTDISVRVPAGADTGDELRIPLGDGIEVIAVVLADAHPFFTRHNNDLHLNVPVTIAEAALGAVVKVPTLDGAIAIRVPPGTPHGRTLRVKGKGVRRGDARGDLLVTVDVVIPAALNDTQRAALETFAAATESPRRHLDIAAEGREQPRG
jgi:molecular chaperone DnaJ